MSILILYATTEGQTRKIARFCGRHLSERGLSTEILPLADATDIDLNAHDGVLVLASVHAGDYQPELGDFAQDYAAVLPLLPNAFLSVSLSAAGDDEDDWKGLEACVARMAEDTGWTPQEVVHVAGAFRFGEYNWLKTWAMRWIAAQKGVDASEGEDVEFTDWAALEAFLDRWTEGVAGGEVDSD